MPGLNRILLTGASGLLGRPAFRELAQVHEAAVMGQAFSRADAAHRRADLRSDSELDALFFEAKPDCVVHCAAERRPDVSEKDPEATDQLNVEATRKLAERCAETGAWLVYLSTDYVFDGSQPPYRPDDTPNPLNHYGRSKLAGEEVALSANPNTLVLRVPVLFGITDDLAESAVTVIGQAVAGAQPKTLDHWAIRYPTFTDDLAVVLRQLVEVKRRDSTLNGIYHWSGSERFTKYEIAQAIAEIWQVDASRLKPDPEAPAGAPRPRNCQLDRGKLEALGIGHNTPFRDALARCIEPFRPQR